jgi:hypothetical protein
VGRERLKARATEATDDPPSTQSKTRARTASGAGESSPKTRRERFSSPDKKGSKDGNPRVSGGQKRKAQDPEYSRPWFAALLADVLKSNDLTGACARADVTPIDLIRARGADPRIDAAMVEVDQLQRAVAVNAVVAAAATGDLRAIKALTDGTLDILTQGLAPVDPPEVARAVADARARANAGDDPQPWRTTDVICPSCNAPSTLEFRDPIRLNDNTTEAEVLLICWTPGDGDRLTVRRWSSRRDPRREGLIETGTARIHRRESQT